MAKLQTPDLFSTHFKVSSAAIDNAGLIDPFVNVDTELFIDPILLEKSSDRRISEGALSAFKQHFSDFIRLLTISGREGDAAWKAARNLLDLSEPPYNGLGYGGTGNSGSSRPEEVRLAIMRTSKEIIELGSKDPEMISLMGFFEENVGPDTISDFTTRTIVDQLAEITEGFCNKQKIPTQETQLSSKFELPVFVNSKGLSSPIVLIPKDIVRDLQSPTAGAMWNPPFLKTSTSAKR